jgi:hypothetical protein
MRYKLLLIDADGNETLCAAGLESRADCAPVAEERTRRIITPLVEEGIYPLPRSTEPGVINFMLFKRRLFSLRIEPDEVSSAGYCTL